MTAEQLGERMGVSQPTVQRLEVSEANGTIHLASLRRAAEALDCELVYVLLPRKTLRETFEDRAQEVAARELGIVRHTMALEDQAVDPDDEGRLRDFIENELDPRELWVSR